MAEAYVALGSNVGDRAKHLREARRLLDGMEATRVRAASRVYETAPVGPLEQGDFYNAVIRLETQLPPRQLLAGMLRLEKQLGRVRRERWGPRIIDLDLLIYDDVRCATDEMILPHPRLHERAFVLQPLCDLAGKLVPPGMDRTVAELLGELDASDIRPLTMANW